MQNLPEGSTHAAAAFAQLPTSLADSAPALIRLQTYEADDAKFEVEPDSDESLVRAMDYYTGYVQLFWSTAHAPSLGADVALNATSALKKTQHRALMVLERSAEQMKIDFRALEHGRRIAESWCSLNYVAPEEIPTRRWPAVLGDQRKRMPADEQEWLVRVEEVLRQLDPRYRAARESVVAKEQTARREAIESRCPVALKHICKQLGYSTASSLKRTLKKAGIPVEQIDGRLCAEREALRSWHGATAISELLDGYTPGSRKQSPERRIQPKPR